MMRSGECSQLAKWDSHIHEKDCFLLPTPQVGMIRAEHYSLNTSYAHYQQGRQIHITQVYRDRRMWPAGWPLKTSSRPAPVMFIEWLMGFPEGWTDLEDSETLSSPKSQNGSDSKSLEEKKMRSPLTSTIKRVKGMIAYVRENLDEGEYDLFLDLILPEPEPLKAAKKGRKKSSKGGSKSSRASGMAAAISNSLNQRRRVAGDNPELTGPTCAKDGCSWKEEDLIHDPRGGYAGYHPFVPAAQPTRGRSSTNGEAGSSTANSETAQEDVSNAHHAGG